MTLEEEMNALEAMLSTPGWKVLEEHVRLIQQSAYNEMMKAEEPHVMAKHMGTFKATKELLDWPRFRIAAHGDAIRQQDFDPYADRRR